MNNVVSWTAVEEEALRRVPTERPLWGQVEYRRPLERDETPEVVSRRGGGGLDVWLVGADGATATSARLGTAVPPAGR